MSPRPVPSARAPGKGDSLLATVRRWDAAKKSPSVDAMRRCLHDDALIETVASDWQPVRAAEAVEAIRTALERDPYYLEGTWHYEPLPSGIVLTAMPVRERSTSGGIRHRTIWRLTSGRDGLIWRQRLFASRDEALAHLEQHGPSLGL